MSSPVRVEPATVVPVARRALEIVERKGLGHPDTICDSVAEAVSRALCRAYLEAAGRVLHHNTDKALLAAGASEPRLGGGRVLEPMRLLVGDRATATFEGRTLPIHEIAVDASKCWIDEHLRYVDPDVHVRVESVLRPGSEQLVGALERRTPVANDTSVGIGCAPRTETEELVLAAERTVNGLSFQEGFPMAGEDVKVMGVRTGRRLDLTLAVAFVDRFVRSVREYAEAKEAMRSALLHDLSPRLSALETLELRINALDREERGPEGLYLTTLGTSADGADSGEVGRGNRVNGLLSFLRPQSLEAAAGKNPVSHVGKIYNILAHRMAAEAYRNVAGLEEVRVFLCSRIGAPVDRPWIAAAEVGLADGVMLQDVEDELHEVLERELAAAPAFVRRLVEEGLPVC